MNLPKLVTTERLHGHDNAGFGKVYDRKNPNMLHEAQLHIGRFLPATIAINALHK
jgi:hypothetical protein